MADDLRLVRVTARQVGYVWATPSEIARVIVGTPHPIYGRTYDGDALLDLPKRVKEWADDYPQAELVDVDEDGDPVGVEDWHDVPPRPEAVARG